MNADDETKAIRKVVESEFKDLLGPELLAVYHSDITSLADVFASTVKCACENEDGQLPNLHIKEHS